jgi:hypothetical protein
MNYISTIMPTSRGVTYSTEQALGVRLGVGVSLLNSLPVYPSSPFLSTTRVILYRDGFHLVTQGYFSREHGNIRQEL